MDRFPEDFNFEYQLRNELPSILYGLILTVDLCVAHMFYTYFYRKISYFIIDKQVDEYKKHDSS